MRASQLNTNPSSTLLTTAVNAIGLRSESIDWGWGTFPKGETSAHFHSEETLTNRRIEDGTYRAAYNWCKVLQQPVRDFVWTN